MRIAPTPTISHRGNQQQRNQQSQQQQQQTQQLQQSPSQSFVSPSPFGVRKSDQTPKQPDVTPTPQQQPQNTRNQQSNNNFNQNQKQQNQQNDYRSNYSSSAAESNPQPQQAARRAPQIKSSISDAGDAREYVQRILDGDPSLSWAIFKFDAGRLIVQSSGAGNFEELIDQFEEENVNFGYVRVPIGSDRRNKFVLIKWTGERCRPVTRARAFEDTKTITKLITVYHIEIPATRRGELIPKNILDRLQAAAGANYDREQNAAQPTHDLSSDLSNYKRSSKQFFKDLEKTGNASPIVYESRPLPKATPVDLSNRQMTVGASVAKQNIVDTVTALGQQQTTVESRRQSTSVGDSQSRRQSTPGGINPYLLAAESPESSRRLSTSIKVDNNNPYLSPAGVRRPSQATANVNPYLAKSQEAPSPANRRPSTANYSEGIVDQYGALESPRARRPSVSPRRPSTAGGSLVQETTV